MRLPADVAAWLQRNLVIMSLDDMSAIGLSGDSLDKVTSETPKQWQFTVDMIYRCLTSNIITVGPTEEWLQAIGLPSIESFASTLAEVNPFDFNSNPGHWIDTYFVSTKFFRLRIANYGLLNADIAETIASNNLRLLEETPVRVLNSSLHSEAELKSFADHFFECAAVSRAAGWYSGKAADVIVPAFVEEIASLFEQHNVPWSEKPLIPINRQT